MSRERRAEYRLERVAAKHRPRYEAGIRKLKIDAVLLANEAGKAKAATRKAQPLKRSVKRGRTTPYPRHDVYIAPLVPYPR